MKAFHILALLSTLFLSAHAKPRVTNPQKPPKNAVLLSSVQSLTLRAGKQTTSRRTSPVPQLTCVGPAHVCKLYNVDMMRCTNEGSDYDAENVQWSCKSSLPEDFKLGSTDVGCEGYESSEDPFVLKGSCGVEYRLLLTEKGEEKFGVKNEKSMWGGSGEGGGLFSFFFMVAFVGILVLMAWSCIRSVREGNGGNLGRNTGGGGGGGGDDPPPPYDPYPDPRPPKKPSTRTYTRSNNGASSRSGQAQGEQWRPGFWTGAAAGVAGAAAGNYLAGNGNRTQAQPETRQTGGGWGVGWGGRSTRPSGSGGGSSSSGSPSYSSSRHTSTGFGGTSRR